MENKIMNKQENKSFPVYHLSTGWNEIPAPPTVAQTGKYQEFVLKASLVEFNCESKEKKRRVIA